LNDIFPKTAKNSGTNVTFHLWFEDFLLSQPLFFDYFETFCRLDPRGKFSLSDETDKLKRYKSLMGFAIYAAFHSRAICLRREMCLRHVSALRVHRGAGIYVRVLSTTFAIGEHIAVLQRKTISRLQSKHIAHRRCISRERSEPKGE